ncbi:MAG: DUF502 domain-containing protein [Bacteroidetes bacterium]|nr:DUF502 domain-containing protein [Bacteroidota bacterium]MBU1578004.1 DUF502 domain-containing protein [Bacteroidota bacterium]MBU2558093.1 DUF502 domain-containing protein [Bacteroidota bacterium]
MITRKLIKKMLRYFFQGLLYIAPVTITIWSLYVIFGWVDGLLISFIDELLKVHIPGLGILVLLVLITLIGALGSTIIFKPLMSFFDQLFVKAPLIKIIYTSVKDLVSAFVGQKRRFNEPVLVKIGKGYELEKIGFITSKDLKFLGVSDQKVAVYLPHSYAWSGNLFIVPIENIKPLDASATEVMKFIISAGVTNLDTVYDEK